MKTKIDITSWNRREHFNFFKDFDDPFFGLTTSLDCTKAYQKAKSSGASFFAYYLYQTLRAANQIDYFNYRIIDDEVWAFDEIHASTIALRDDGTFAFTFVEYSESFEEFSAQVRSETEAVRNSTGLRLNENSSRLDVMHYSTLPWIDFTSISHARKHSKNDSMQKITFGQMTHQQGQYRLPFSIHAHHALLDGKHIGEYLELLQSLLNE